MAFGAQSGQISRNEQNTVEVAKKLDHQGNVTELRTHGGMQEVTVEAYSDGITNAAVNGQSGSSVTSTHGLAENNTDFAKSTVVTQATLAAVTITTTTTTTTTT